MLREICIMRTLNHSNIVKIKDIKIPPNSENYNNVYIAMEFADADLKKLCKSPTYLDHSQVRFLLYQAICGCRYMHSANIMHRDIKSANILINSNCSLKICDFGLSHSYNRLNQNFEQTYENCKIESLDLRQDEDMGRGAKKMSRILTEHVVTRWYRAPEVILMEREYGKEIDVWSLGCVFAEMLGMIRENIPQYVERTPLFPGRSCFPLSPDLSTHEMKAGYPCAENDQLSLIFQVVGNEQDLSFVSDPKARRYVEAFPPAKAKDLREVFSAITANELDLLMKMIAFNPKNRISLDQALNHPYFFPVRNPDYEMLASDPAHFAFDSDQEVDMLTIREHFRREVSRMERCLKEKLMDVFERVEEVEGGIRVNVGKVVAEFKPDWFRSEGFEFFANFESFRVLEIQAMYKFLDFRWKEVYEECIGKFGEVVVRCEESGVKCVVRTILHCFESEYVECVQDLVEMHLKVHEEAEKKMEKFKS